MEIDLSTRLSWRTLQSSEMLKTAITTKDEEAIQRAFKCCESLYKKAYKKLKSGKYELAARHYIMAGWDSRTLLRSIKRWGMSFKDNLAREAYNRRSLPDYMRPNFKDLKGLSVDINAKLPSSAPCVGCGVRLVKPAGGQQIRCPNCGKVQTYAEQLRDLVTAQVMRSKHGLGLTLEEGIYASVKTSYRDPRTNRLWASSVKTLISLALHEKPEKRVTPTRDSEIEVAESTDFASLYVIVVRQVDDTNLKRLLSLRVRCGYCRKVANPVLALQDGGGLACPNCGQWWVEVHTHHEQDPPFWEPPSLPF